MNEPPSAQKLKTVFDEPPPVATELIAQEVLPRFQGQAQTTLDAALHGNNIPTSVVENLIETTRAGVEPLRRDHRLRRRVLGVPTYQVYDFAIPLVTHDKTYDYDEVLVALSDADRLMRLLRDAAAAWPPAEVRLHGSAALEWPGDENVWSRLHGVSTAALRLGGS